MHLLALANENIECPTIPVGYCSYCASFSRMILVLLPPLVLLLLLFFWQFKEKIKQELPATARSKIAGSSSLQAVCVCARCSMWSGGAQRSHKFDAGGHSIYLKDGAPEVTAGRAEAEKNDRIRVKSTALAAKGGEMRRATTGS